MDRLIGYDKQLAWLVMVLFFLPMRVQMIGLISIFLFWSVRDSLKGTKKPGHPYRWVLLLGSVFLLYLAYLPFTADSYRPDLLFQLEKRAGLLVGPLAFLFIQPQTRKVLLGELLFFVFACLLSCLVGNIAYLFQYGWHPNGPTAHVLYRVYFDETTGIHPTYMGIYLCFSIAILLFSSERQRLLRSWQTVTLLAFLLVFLIALMPKAPVLGLIIIFLYYGWVNRRQHIRKMAPVLAVLILSVSVACISIPFSGQRIEELSELLQTRPSSNPMTNSVRLRQLIWTIDQEVLQEHWLTGMGPTRLDAELTARYGTYSRRLGVPLAVYNTHNEYIHQWLCFGIVGIGLFLLVLGIQFVRAVRRDDHLYVCLLIVLSITFFTENILARQHGILFYACFCSLFLFNGLTGNRKRPQLQKSEAVTVQPLAEMEQLPV